MRQKNSRPSMYVFSAVVMVSSHDLFVGRGPASQGDRHGGYAKTDKPRVETRSVTIYLEVNVALMCNAERETEELAKLLSAPPVDVQREEHKKTLLATARTRAELAKECLVCVQFAVLLS